MCGKEKETECWFCEIFSSHLNMSFPKHLSFFICYISGSQLTCVLNCFQNLAILKLHTYIFNFSLYCINIVYKILEYNMIKIKRITKSLSHSNV